MGTVHAKQHDEGIDTPNYVPLGDEYDGVANQSSNHNGPKPFSLEGIRARVDKIHIDGLARTHDDIVKDTVKDLLAADSFEDVIVRSHKVRTQLESLGCFKGIGIHIDVSSGPEATPDGLEVTFQVSELSRLVGGVNTTVGNNEGSMVIGVKMPNTCGRGEKVQCEYSMGNRRTSNFSVLWMKPFPGRKFTPTLSASLFQQASEYPWSGYSLLDKGLLLDFGFKTSNYTKHNLQWEGLLRNTSIMANRSKDASFTVREDCGPVLKSILRHIVSVDRRDDVIFPTSGTLVQFTSELSGLGGGVAYLKNDLSLQANQEIYQDYVIQAGIQSGVLYNIHDTKLSDRFFLGGPLTLRGFQQSGAGPQKDGSSLGGTMYWSTGLHLFAPLPFRPGRGGIGDSFRSHLFINAGNLIHANQADDLGGTLRDLLRNVRASVGAGLAVRVLGVARFELNYCVPIRSHAQDYTAPGVQFGIGINFL